MSDCVANDNIDILNDKRCISMHALAAKNERISDKKLATVVSEVIHLDLSGFTRTHLDPSMKSVDFHGWPLTGKADA